MAGINYQYKNFNFDIFYDEKTFELNKKEILDFNFKTTYERGAFCTEKFDYWKKRIDAFGKDFLKTDFINKVVKYNDEKSKPNCFNNFWGDYYKYYDKETMVRIVNAVERYIKYSDEMDYLCQKLMLINILRDDEKEADDFFNSITAVLINVKEEKNKNKKLQELEDVLYKSALPKVLWLIRTIAKEKDLDLLDRNTVLSVIIATRSVLNDIQYKNKYL